MAYELFCIIPNGKPAFVVNIDETRTVASLKVAIKAVKAPELDHIAPDNLTLYRVNLDGSDEPEYIKEAERFAESLVNLDLHPLKQFDLLDMVFPEPPNSRDRNIHIFVILPPGKPINSRAYRLALIVYHSPITPLSSNIDLDMVRILHGPPIPSSMCPPTIRVRLPLNSTHADATPPTLSRLPRNPIQNSFRQRLQSNHPEE